MPILVVTVGLVYCVYHIRLVVGRMDGSVGFYQIELADDGAMRYSCIGSIQAHHEPVSHLKCGGGYAASGGADHRVQVLVVSGCIQGSIRQCLLCVGVQCS